MAVCWSRHVAATLVVAIFNFGFAPQACCRRIFLGWSEVSPSPRALSGCRSSPRYTRRDVQAQSSTNSAPGKHQYTTPMTPNQFRKCIHFCDLLFSRPLSFRAQQSRLGAANCLSLPRIRRSLRPVFLYPEIGGKPPGGEKWIHFYLWRVVRT